MLPLRYADRWRLASMILLLIVLVSMLMPVMWFWPDRRELVSWFIGVDKWLHGLTFVVLAVWFAGQYRRRSYWRIGVGLIFFGMFIEACQRLVTYRSADWFDVVANTAGIVTGLLVATAGVGGWSLRVEEWLAGSEA
jgi:VanZ family protein